MVETRLIAFSGRIWKEMEMTIIRPTLERRRADLMLYSLTYWTDPDSKSELQ